MACLLGLVLLLAAFYGFAFGATRLLLRRSPWEQYSLEAAWLTGPALIVLMLSLLAYRVPTEVFVWQAWLVLAGGLGLTVVVVIWDRRELAELVRAHWLRWLTITLPALVGCGVMWAYFNDNVWDDVSVPRISEYVNYAAMAATLTGHHQEGEAGSLICPILSYHRPLRFGQDLIVATVAQIAQRHPMQVIVPIAMVFRFQQTIAIGLLLCGLVRTRKQLLVVFAFLLAEALVMFETISFASSFFSSNCTMPLFAIYLAWLACQQEIRVREGIIVVLMNLFFMLTYPEFLVLAKCFEALSIAVALWRRHLLHWLPLVICNLALLLSHPLLVYAKYEAITGQFGGINTAGGSMIGDPVRAPLRFPATLLGLRSRNFPEKWLQPIVWAAGFYMFAQVVIGLTILARRQRAGLMLLAWAGGLVLVHVQAAPSGNYYIGFKILSHTYFLVIVGGTAAVLASTPRWRTVTSGVVVLWIAMVVGSTNRQILQVRHDGYALSYGQLRAALARSANGREVAVLTDDIGPCGLVNLVSGETGVSVAPITKYDQDHVEKYTVGHGVKNTTTAADGTKFRGLVLVNAQVLQSGKLEKGCVVLWIDESASALRFECDKVVEDLGLVQLCEGRIYELPSH